MMKEWMTAQFWETLLDRTIAWSLSSLPAILLIAAIGLMGFKLVDVILDRIRRNIAGRLPTGDAIETQESEKRLETLLGILRSALRVVLWAMVVMLLLRRMGVDIAPLIAGAGIAGLAVGFGAQELVRDVISGFFMLMENQVRAGDIAVVNGVSGLVEQVGLRTIVLRDQSGTVHVFQNGKVNTLANMTKGWSAMVFDVAVAYRESTDRVIEAMKEAAESLRADDQWKSFILEPMEVFGVDGFGDSAVIIKGRIKTRPGDQWSIGREYRKRLKEAFDKNHIEIPFPTSTITWAEDTAPIKLKIHNKEDRD